MSTTTPVSPSTSSPAATPWLECFRAETSSVIVEPFFRCLAEAVATVESGGGRHPIASPTGLNEIGYKAIAGHPSTASATREANPDGTLRPTTAAFRIFRNRTEQARALLWLLRSSHFYDAARLLFILTFYGAYAPGRTAGARELVKVFNRIAASGVHEGVRPLCLADPVLKDDELLALNHAAARDAVRLFAELTGAK